MTSANNPNALNSQAFGALFDAATVSVFRLEGRQFYAGDTSYKQWAQRAGRPERSVRTSPWLARIARSTAEGVSWSRVRVVTEPVTDYTRYELLTYVEAQAVGEQVGIVGPDPGGDGQVPHTDFWLIDHGTTAAVGVWMHYGDDGVLRSRVKVDDAATLQVLGDEAHRLTCLATSLNEWLPTSGQTLVG